jgi:hypothetical protein
LANTCTTNVGERSVRAILPKNAESKNVEAKNAETKTVANKK